MSEAVKEPKLANPNKKTTKGLYVTEKEFLKLKEVLELMRKNEGKW